MRMYSRAILRRPTLPLITRGGTVRSRDADLGIDYLDNYAIGCYAVTYVIYKCHSPVAGVDLPNLGGTTNGFEGRSSAMARSDGRIRILASALRVSRGPSRRLDALNE